MKLNVDEKRAVFIINVIVVIAVMAMLIGQFILISNATHRGEEAHRALCVIEQNTDRRIKSIEVILSDPDLPGNLAIFYDRQKTSLEQQQDELSFLDCVGG